MSTVRNHAPGKTITNCSVSFLAAFILGAAGFTASALENEIWISPIGPAASIATNNYPSDTIGSPTYPFRCPNASSLNWVLAHDLNRTNLTIHLMGGTFQVLPMTVSSNYGIVMKNGWKLRGAGIDNTVLQLQPCDTPNAGVYVVIAPLYAPEGGTEVSDLTVDCNLQNQIRVLNVQAVDLAGNNARISRVKAINWGTVSVNECFPLSIGTRGRTYQTNGIIEDCEVTQPSTANTGNGGCCLITIATAGSSTPELTSLHVAGAIVRNNMVDNIIIEGSKGHICAYAGTPGVTLSHNRVMNVLATNPKYYYNAAAVYEDTWWGRDIVIEDNIFENVSTGIFYNAASLGLTNLVIRNNIIQLAQGGVGVYFYSGASSEPVTNLLLKDNIIEPVNGATKVTALYLNCSNISASVLGNVLQGSAPGYDFFNYYSFTPTWARFVPTATFPNWSENVNLTGTQLNVSPRGWQPGDHDTITFTPSSDGGWYRLFDRISWAAAYVRIGTGQWTNKYTMATDTEFWFRVNAYATTTNKLGEVVESRRGSYYYPYSGVINQVRIGCDATGANMDIFVPAVAGPTRPITITMTGPYRTTMNNPPTNGATASAVSLTYTLP